MADGQERGGPCCLALGAAAAGVAVAVTRDEKFCTLIGGVTGVTVHLSEGHRGRADRTTVCVAGRCKRVRRQGAGILFPLNASVPRVVQVVFVLERDGEPADVRTMTTRLKRFEPNAADCPGTFWTAAVRPEQARPAVSRRRP